MPPTPIDPAALHLPPTEPIDLTPLVTQSLARR